MEYRIGIEFGPEQTSWVTVGRDGSGPERVDGGEIESVVGLVDGEVVVGEGAADQGGVQEVTRGFVQRLGESDAVILGGTPYGVEALIGRLIAAAVHAAGQLHGSPPGGILIVHEDGLDEFRKGLLTEAARLAGVPVSDVVLVSRSEALAAQPEQRGPGGSATANGAAHLGWKLRPDSLASSVGLGASELGVAATGTAAGAGGAAVVATALGDSVAGASAGAALTTPAGVGPAGTTLSAPAGAGPAGSPLPTPATGPTGSPLTPPAGPAGTPLTPPTGPTGSPLGPVPTPGSGGIPRVLKRPRKMPMIIGAGVAAVAVATTVVVATKDADSSSTSPTTTVVSGADNTILTSITEATTETTVETTSTTPAPAVPACLPGVWTARNESFAEYFSTTMGVLGEGEVVADGVSGSVQVDIAEDGTWTVTHNAWTMSASAPALGATVTITIDGVDVSTSAFNPDGTYAFTEVTVGSAVTFSATVGGMAFPVPEIDDSPTMTSGSGTYTCSGDELVLSVDAPGGGGAFILDRTG